MCVISSMLLSTLYIQTATLRNLVVEKKATKMLMLNGIYSPCIIVRTFYQILLPVQTAIITSSLDVLPQNWTWLSTYKCGLEVFYIDLLQSRVFFLFAKLVSMQYLLQCAVLRQAMHEKCRHCSCKYMFFK